MAEHNLQVVFVCEHGAAKSVVAQAYFNQMAVEMGLPACAVSRGTAPDPAIQPGVSEGLAADRIALGEFTPQCFAPADLEGAAIVVSFDQPSVADSARGRVPAQAWDGLPKVSEGYEIARDSIRERVRALVDSLAHQRGT